MGRRNIFTRFMTLLRSVMQISGYSATRSTGYTCKKNAISA